MLNKVSQQIVDAVLVRLTATNGYNQGINSQAPKYSLDPASMLLDFSATSQNFYLDQINSEEYEKAGIIRYPFGMLYVLESMGTNEQKFSQFSGSIRLIFEINLSWVPIKGQRNREFYSNCVEDVVFDVINRVENQNWGKPLVYNGQIQCRRAATQIGAQNYKKRVVFPMLFGIHQ